ncbi:uncharacterized protein LOC105355531 [Oryzias latipes]
MKSRTFTTIINKYFEGQTVTCSGLLPCSSKEMNLGLRESGPLLRGLRSLNNLSEMLLSTNSDMVLPGCQTFDNMRQEIQDMKQHLEESEQIVAKELQHLDEETESLTAEKSSLEEQKKKREGELGDLRLQLDSNGSSLQSYKDALKTEKDNLQTAETTLRNMRKKRDEAETIRDIGTHLMVVPVLGWIAGGVMLGVGQNDLDSASEQIAKAQSEVEKCESQITSYSNQVSRYEGLLSQAQTDIKEANRRIHETGLKLLHLALTRSTVEALQSKTKKVVHQLGLLCGVASVAELQTRCLILLEPVLNVVAEMMGVLLQINDDDPLYSEKLESIMLDISKNIVRVADKIASENQVQI